MDALSILSRLSLCLAAQVPAHSVSLLHDTIMLLWDRHSCIHCKQARSAWPHQIPGWGAWLKGEDSTLLQQGLVLTVVLQGITVNGIGPGYMKTDNTAALQE